MVALPRDTMPVRPDREMQVLRVLTLSIEKHARAERIGRCCTGQILLSSHDAVCGFVTDGRSTSTECVERSYVP